MNRLLKLVDGSELIGRLCEWALVLAVIGALAAFIYTVNRL